MCVYVVGAFYCIDDLSVSLTPVHQISGFLLGRSCKLFGRSHGNWAVYITAR